MTDPSFQKTLTIHLTGNNVLNTAEFGIYNWNDVIVFTGNGNLTVSSTNRGVCTTSDILIDGPDLTVSGNVYDIFCSYLFIKQGTVAEVHNNSPYVGRYTADQFVTVTFNANGGTGTMFPKWIPKSKSRLLRSNSFVYEGHFFCGWNTAPDGSGDNYVNNESINNPTADLTLYAQWLPDQYTITFQNDNGTMLQSGDVAYGDTPVYTGETPTKAADAQHTYTFAGWDAEIVPVTGIATYTATYNAIVNKYTITFKDEDETVLQSSDIPYGDTPVYTGETPTKAADAQYTYTFAGWDAEIVPVTGIATYTVTYNNIVNKYTIAFVNDDSAELQSSEVNYGDTPVYAGETPTKAVDDQYTYTFVGWAPEIAPVVGAATYTAVYDNSVNLYTVTFIDDDGTELQRIEIAYGETPVYAGAAPAKAATDAAAYTFSGWSPEITAVSGDAAYTATYSAEAIKHTVAFETNGGSAVPTATVKYGDPVAEPDAPVNDTLTFVGWYADKDMTTRYDFTAPVVSDVKIYAKWTSELYPVLSGDNAVYTEGSGETLTIVVKRSEADETCFAHFTGVEIDGAALERGTDYTAVAGSTVVTLNPAALQKLSVGSHTVSILFDDGKVNSTLTVRSSSNGSPDENEPLSPQTGDDTYPTLWIPVSTASAIGLSALAFERKKRVSSK